LPWLAGRSTAGREEPVSKPKPFEISKEVVWEAYLRVKANKGAAGVDGESIEEFERDLKGNLYKLWNRMSSGCYFPPPVRMVEIPKPGGQGVRVLGVPTVADRIAQTVVRMYLEPKVEPIFHPDSYGYRPGRSALDAVATCRERCWKADWVIDLDIKAFFDTLDHELVMRAVRKHTEQAWVVLYVQRWLEAPMQREDGSLVARDRGSPQGSAISPLLANLFMHYAFDSWMRREFPAIGFERYCDDAVVHCRSERQARYVREAIAKRLAECRLELSVEKTRIVYCKDELRKGSHEHERFDFLGYGFRPRLSKSRAGKHFVNFSPAVSDEAGKAMRREIRNWKLHERSDKTLSDLARMFNVIVQGWINYYGRFYKSELYPTLRPLNEYLVRWARRKYKRLRGHQMRARRMLADVARREPNLFAHWRFGLRPDGWATGAV
jgi:RNA-directed DNA polymerase